MSLLKLIFTDKIGDLINTLIKKSFCHYCNIAPLFFVFYTSYKNFDSAFDYRYLTNFSLILIISVIVMVSGCILLYFKNNVKLRVDEKDSNATIKEIELLKKKYENSLEKIKNDYKKEIEILNKKLQQQEFILEIIQKSENDLLKSTIFTDELLNNLPVAVYVKDPKEGKFIYWNKKSEEIFGFTSSEALGKTDYDLFPLEQAEFFTQKDFQTFSSKNVEDIFGEVVYNPKLGQIYLHSRKVPLFDKDNNPLYLLSISENITEIKKAEGTLKLQSMAMDNIIDGMVITDPLQFDNPIIFCNAAFEKITGFTFNEVVGKNPRILQGAKTDICAKEKLRQSVKMGDQCNVTILNYRKDGRPFWNEIKIIPIKDHANKLVNFLGIKTDITEKINAENALKGSETKFRSIVEQSGDGIILCNKEGKIIEWNLSMEKITGLSKEEVFNHFLCDVQFRLLPDENKSQEKYNHIKQILTDLLKTDESHSGSLSIEQEIARKDGSRVLIQSVIFPILSENGIMAGSMVRDITKKHEDEEALNQSEHKYRLVVDNIKEVIFQTDAEGKWISLNRAWEEITGFTLKESLGTIFIKYVHPDDRARNQVQFEALVNREKDYCRHVVRYITKDSGLRYIEVYARLTLNEKGEIIGTSGSLYDVTEKAKAEQEIKATLFKEKELNQLKSRMISTVSHEFRTPLTSILASTELTIRYIDKWDKEKQIATLERVQNSAEFLNEMVGDVLKLNKVELGNDRFYPKTMELIELCKKILDELTHLFSSQHELIFNYAPNEIMGKFDEKMMKSILVNLLTNAVKYSPNGGKIEFQILLQNESVFFIISDEGLGIPDEDKKNLFSPFFRGNNIGSIPGTGLGLSIVQKTVELHGGKINFESNTSKGTKFTVVLPLEK